MTAIRIGMDVGSTTVKAVVLDQGYGFDAEGQRIHQPFSQDDPQVLFADYRRHHANVRATAQELLTDIHQTLAAAGRGEEPVQLAITGSGGISLADHIHVPFIQEVISETDAIEEAYPQADVIIELGGEDAKITYLKPTPEQRMNGSCAGGTGAFIDQTATLLDTDAEGLNDLAKDHKILYPIASRCGVFAKSDLQPLINDGAAKPDLAASIFAAVATQTIAGLANGRPVKGTVVFLGGPLFFMSELRAAFQRLLAGRVEDFITPESAHLYVAYGAALAASNPDSADIPAAARKRHEESGLDIFAPRTCRQLLDDIDNLKNLPSENRTMRPLFLTPQEREEFGRRHGKEHVVTGTLEGAQGPHFLGIDAGSTTIKATLINDDQEIVWSSYGANEGSPLLAAANIIKEIEKVLPAEAYIARSCTTGYGEGLIKAGLHCDEGVVETMAHYRGAEIVSPGVTSVIDIGGQDMKYLSIDDGVIESISVNEACSAGCGSFLQTFAQSMGLTIDEFTQAALRSQAPVDLGSRCTVFMNSSVKQAQKEGASIEDIAAGLCYSVVRNALYKVIKLRDTNDLGDTVVVQGGTFLNDAVLRAFELLTGRQVERPNIAGLMGAYGCALTARMHYDEDEASGSGEADGGQPARTSMLSGDQLDQLSMTTERDVCNLCQNKCKLTITTFQDGSRYVTGNRCERGGDKNKKRSPLPNMYDYKYKRVFGYRRLSDKKATRGAIGIPRVLNMYENYPFWFTLLTSLGFKVELSRRSSHELFQKGIDSIASENICYPAKLAHGHMKDLLDKGITTIFYPCVFFEKELAPDQDNKFNCPIVANYPGVIGANMEELRDPAIRYMHPYFNMANPDKMVDRIVEEFAWAQVSREEAEKAVAAAYAEDKIFKHDVRMEGLRALTYMKEHGLRGIVLAGRPYHVDPEINHGIPEAICTMGMVVLTEDSVSWLEPGRKLNLTPFIGEEEANPRLHTKDGFRQVDDGYDPYNLRGAKLISDGQAAPGLASRPAGLGSAGLGSTGQATLQGRSKTASGDYATVAEYDDPLQEAFDSSHQVYADGQGSRPPLRVMNQWAYHARLYAAARFVSQYPSLELVQLNSFGCGLDAITTDQVQEVLGEKEDVYTVLKIDEVSNLGAAKIRLRSLKAAVEERARRASGATTTTGFHRTVRKGATMSKYARIVPFTKKMKKTHTILLPQMSPVHFGLLESVFRSGGYKAELLEHASKADIEFGLKYVNNDACYPSILVVGQLVNAIAEGRYDPDHVALAITQTGGMCRATNYYGLIRKALVDAGYPQVPVIAISTQGFVDNPGFSITPALLHRAVKALYLGDLLMKVLYRTRPYEQEAGSADRLYARWDAIGRETLEHHGFSATAKKHYGRPYLTYNQLCRGIVRAFDALPLRRIPRKPRVGVVGEILVKYQPDANNNVVRVIESQDCEAVVPGMMEFMTQTMYSYTWNQRVLGQDFKAVPVRKLARFLAEKYRNVVEKALALSHGKFSLDATIPELMEKAQTVTSIGVQAGEGWLLSAEMVDLIETGTPNIICAQPFACLPNHVTGRGMFHEIRRQHPEANIVSIDYDPGSSEANQLNRIKLMIAAGKKSAKKAKMAEPLGEGAFAKVGL